MPFRVFDSSGNLKIGVGGSGASLPDPLTVAHGGTSLTQAAKGGLIYASAANTLALRVPDTDNDIMVPKAFCNVLFPGETAATDPRLGLVPRWVATSFFGSEGGGVASQGGFRGNASRVALSQACATAAAFSGSYATGSSTGNITLSTPTSFAIDDTSTWETYQTAGAGSTNYSGWNSDTQTWAQHLPFCEVKFRTSSDITSFRLIFALKTSTAFLAGSDDQSGRIGVGMRYSTVAADTGFMTWTSNGTVQTVGSQIAAIAASTIYTASIDVRNGVAEIIISSGSTVSKASVTIPIEMNSVNLIYALHISNASGSGTRQYDITSVYHTVQSFLTP